MVVRNKIWEEIKQAYANVLCLQWYTDKQRKYERWYNMFIALVASGGNIRVSDKFDFSLSEFWSDCFCCSSEITISIFPPTRENYAFLMV